MSVKSESCEQGYFVESGRSRAYQQARWEELVQAELASVASFDPRPEAKPPEALPAFQAVAWEIGALGVDIRPHVFEPVMKRW